MKLVSCQENITHEAAGQLPGERCWSVARRTLRMKLLVSCQENITHEAAGQLPGEHYA